MRARRAAFLGNLRKEEKLMVRWRWLATAVVMAGLGAGGSPALACVLCKMSAQNRQTFRQDLDQAVLVVYGTVANPRFSAQGPPGSGISDFHILSVLKNE